MLIARLTALAGFALAATAFAVMPAEALTTKECSTKYQAAKEAGTLGDMKWNDFRKAECGPGSTMDIAVTVLTGEIEDGARPARAKCSTLAWHLQVSKNSPWSRRRRPRR